MDIRPGEKDFEELLNIEEIRRTIELENYFCILPVYSKKEYLNEKYPNIVNHDVTKEYSSAKSQLCSKKEIKDLLSKIDLNL